MKNITIIIIIITMVITVIKILIINPFMQV